MCSRRTTNIPAAWVFDVFGDDKIQQFNIKAGQELTVSFDIAPANIRAVGSTVSVLGA